MHAPCIAWYSWRSLGWGGGGGRGERSRSVFDESPFGDSKRRGGVIGFATLYLVRSKAERGLPFEDVVAGGFEDWDPAGMFAARNLMREAL